MAKKTRAEAPLPPPPPREIIRTTRFSRDYKREQKGQYRDVLDDELTIVLDALVNRLALQVRHKDHMMSGEWKDFRNCHVRPDLVLIYRIDGDTVQLARLGSHAELGI